MSFDDDLRGSNQLHQEFDAANYPVENLGLRQIISLDSRPTGSVNEDRISLEAATIDLSTGENPTVIIGRMANDTYEERGAGYLVDPSIIVNSAGEHRHDVRVSRNHGVVSLVDGRVVYTDDGSKHGTTAHIPHEQPNHDLKFEQVHLQKDTEGTQIPLRDGMVLQFSANNPGANEPGANPGVFLAVYRTDKATAPLKWTFIKVPSPQNLPPSVRLSI